MGNTPVENSKLKEFQTKYQTIKVLHDPRYGDCRILQSKSTAEEILLKEINMSDTNQFQKLMNKFDNRISNPQKNIVNLLQTYSTEDSQLCGKFFKIYLVFEYFAFSLESIVHQHKIQGVQLKEQDLWDVLLSSIKALSYLQSLGISHQAIRPSTISIKFPAIKLCDPTLFSTVTSFAAVLQDFTGMIKGYFLSPILVQESNQLAYAIESGNYHPKHNPYKSDVFSLGMTMLYATIFDPLDSIYRFDLSQAKFNQTEFDKAMQKLDRSGYSEKYIQTLRFMLSYNEESRPDFFELEKDLQNVQYESNHQTKNSQKPIQLQKQDYEIIKSQTQQLQVSSQPKFVQFPQSSPLSSQIKQSQIKYSQNQQSQLRSGDGLQQDHPDNLNNKIVYFQPTQQSVIDINMQNENIEINNMDNSQSWNQSIPIMPVTAQNDNNKIDIDKDIERIKNAYQFEFSRAREKQLESSQQSYDRPPPIDPENNFKMSYIRAEQEPQNNFKDIQKQQQNQQQYASINSGSYLYQSRQQPAQIQSQTTHTHYYEQSTHIQSNPQSQSQSNFQVKEFVIEDYQNKSRYEGEKMNNMRHGKGKFYYADGGVYDGHWHQNRMHGYGMLYYPSGRVAYEGYWVEDKFEGQGKLFNENPERVNGELNYEDLDQLDEFWTKYEGGFHDDNKEGQGILVFSNNDQFEGYFLADQACGPGRYMRRNGQIIEGSWWKNKLQDQ